MKKIIIFALTVMLIASIAVSAYAVTPKLTFRPELSFRPES